MNLKLPDIYEAEEIAEILNKAFDKIEAMANDKKMKKLTTAGTQPPDVEEDELRLHVDGNTREVVFRNQSQTYVLTATKR